MSNVNPYVTNFLDESKKIIEQLNQQSLEDMVQVLVETKKRGGRLFFAGSGGGAGHSSHATCDFRKLAGIESYSITDNVSELTARINDESWDSAYASYLAGSRMNDKDCLFVFSVGGGDDVKKISVNLVEAMKYSKQVGASVVGVAGRDGGYLAKVADACAIVPVVDPKNITTQAEGFQALLWHLIVCHPSLDSATPMWESVS